MALWCYRDLFLFASHSFSQIKKLCSPHIGRKYFSPSPLFASGIKNGFLKKERNIDRFLITKTTLRKFKDTDLNKDKTFVFKLEAKLTL